MCFSIVRIRKLYRYGHILKRDIVNMLRIIKPNEKVKKTLEILNVMSACHILHRDQCFQHLKGISEHIYTKKSDYPCCQQWE